MNNAKSDFFADTKVTSLYDTLLNNVSRQHKVCRITVLTLSENYVQDIPKASFEAMTATISDKSRIQKIQAYSRFVKHLRKDTIIEWVFDDRISPVSYERSWYLSKFI